MPFIESITSSLTFTYSTYSVYKGISPLSQVRICLGFEIAHFLLEFFSAITRVKPDTSSEISITNRTDSLYYT